MSIKVPDQGLQNLLEDLRLKLNSLGNIAIRLFNNNYTPAAGDTPSSYTEATFPGYSRVNTTLGAATIDTTAHKATTTAPIATFLCTGGGTTEQIYGYYVLDASANLLWSERFTGAPFSMSNNGDVIAFQPLLTMISQF